MGVSPKKQEKADRLQHLQTKKMYLLKKLIRSIKTSEEIRNTKFYVDIIESVKSEIEFLKELTDIEKLLEDEIVDLDREINQKKRLFLKLSDDKYLENLLLKELSP